MLQQEIWYQWKFINIWCQSVGQTVYSCRGHVLYNPIGAVDRLLQKYFIKVAYCTCVFVRFFCSSSFVANKCWFCSLSSACCPYLLEALWESETSGYEAGALFHVQVVKIYSHDLLTPCEPWEQHFFWKRKVWINKFSWQAVRRVREQAWTWRRDEGKL